MCVFFVYMIYVEVIQQFKSELTLIKKIISPVDKNYNPDMSL